MKRKTFLLTISALFIFMSGNAQNNSSTFTDSRDGETYKFVSIGKQVWMAENLRYTNGKYIESNSEWAELEDNFEDSGYCWLDNDIENKSSHGALYTYAAALNACPSGWHLPSDKEWSELESYLIDAGYNSDLTKDEDKTAKALASKTGWKNSSESDFVGNKPENNNKIGFTALPTGFRDDKGEFGSAGEGVYFWSTYTETKNTAYYRYISYNSCSLDRSYCFDKSYGFSIRCIKD